MVDFIGSIYGPKDKKCVVDPRKIPGKNKSDKDANTDGEVNIDGCAFPKKLSNELSEEAKKNAIDSGRGIQHDQDALNEIVNKYNFYASQNPPMGAGDLLQQYYNIQSGKQATNITNTPTKQDDVPNEAMKQYNKDAPGVVGRQIIFDKAVGKVLPMIFPKRVPTETGPGMPPKAAPTPVGEPVSVATGEYLETWRDFVIRGVLAFDGARQMALKLPLPERHVSPLGPCQTTAFDETILNPDHGQLDFHQADGKVVRFDRPFNFLVSYNAGYPHLDLRAPWLKQLELRDRNRIKHFRQYDDRIYRLEKIEDLNGNAIIFHRNEAGWLERADGPNGLALDFANDAQGHRTRITLIGTDGSRLELARYSYGARGHMVAADCAFGMSVRYYWDIERNLLLRWHNLTKRSETHFTYDEAGRVVHTRTNGIWNDDRFRYDPGKRETTYFPSGDEKLAQRFAYDENDNVTEETDALGHIVKHTFDRAGFETATTDANGHASSTAYDIWGNVKHFTDAEGRGTTYGWGPHGELDRVIDGTGNLRTYDNDQNGNTLAETDAEGHTTRYIRDERGRLLRTIFADGAEESRTYDAHGRLATIIDAKGGTTRFAHDVFGRTIETIDALGHVTRTDYAAGAGGFDTPTSITRPDGVTIRRAYSSDGVLASVTDGEGRRWTYTYGAFDVLQAIEDPKGGRLAFAYDGEGRVTAVTNQMGVTYHLIRDAAGRVIAEEDFDGRRTEYTRDPGGRVVETKKPDGVRLAYTYDRTDKLTSIKGFATDDPENTRPLEETHYWYDSRGLLIRASNLAALVEFERDKNGRITCESVNGRRVESKLDARGNRIERRIGQSQTNKGEPGEGLVRYTHDPLGLVASITIDDHAPLVFTRDALGRETRRASAKGFRLDQTWDSVGQLMSQSAGHGPSGLGGLSGAPMSGLPDMGHSKTPAPGTSAERHYAWDKAGAPVGIDDLIWGQTTYAYDANGQVAKAEFGDGFTEKFDYDAAKNVAGVKLQGPEIGPGLGGLLAWRSTAGGVVQLARGPNGESIALTHDTCGRVVTRRVDRKGFRPKTWRYGWDALDRLVSCETPEGDSWFYRYDPFGRRLTKVRKLREAELAWTAQKFSNLVTKDAREKTKIWSWPEAPTGTQTDGRPVVVGTYFTWDGSVVEDEAPLRLDGSVDWISSTRWHFEPIGFHPLAKQSPEGHLIQIVKDHLGAPREMFDDSGSLLWATSLGTRGTVRGTKTSAKQGNYKRRSIYPRKGAASSLAILDVNEEAPLECPIRFQGQWADKETDIYYNFYRYYDPCTMQYYSSDPIGTSGGFRPHAYVIRATIESDPLGLTTNLRNMTSGAETGQGFSGVYDTKTGQMAMRPSSYGRDIPDGHVPARGGHSIVVKDLPGDPGSKVGFAAVRQADGSYKLTYTSRTLNYPFTGGTSDQVPSGIQPQIQQTFEKVTGQKAF